MSDEDQFEQLKKFLASIEQDRAAAKGVVRLDEAEMRTLMLLLRGGDEKPAILPRVALIEKKLSGHGEILHGPAMKPEDGLVQKVAKNAKAVGGATNSLRVVFAGLLAALGRALWEWFSRSGPG